MLLAEELVNPMIPVLRSADTVAHAIDVMQDSQQAQLPLVEGDIFQGIFDEDSLLQYPNDRVILGQLPIDSRYAYAQPQQHIYELMGMAQRHQLKVIPVVEATDGVFVGSIAVNDMYARFAELLGVQEEGAVLVIKLTQRDYSMTEISRLIESNGTKILSSFWTGTEFDALLNLKLDQRDVAAAVATLERFGYNVVGVYGNHTYENIDKSRIDLLLRYIEV